MKTSISVLICVIAFIFKTTAQVSPLKDIPDGMYASSQLQAFSPSDLIPVDSHRFVYNTKGYLLNDTIYLFSFPKTFTVSRYLSYSYDTAGRVIQVILNYWDNNTKSPVYWSKRNISYNGDGNMTADIIGFWNAASKSYTPGYRDLYYYNGSGQLLTRSYQEWQSGTYITQDLYEYSYDKFGNLKTEKKTNQFSSGDYDYKVFTYDNGNKLLSDSTFVFDNLTTKMYLYSVYALSYDNSERVFTIRQQQYQPIPGSLVGMSIDTVIYNTDGTWKLVKNYKLNSGGSMQKGPFTYYSYNNNFSIITKKADIEVKKYYYNNSILAANNKFIPKSISVYPNPTSGVFSVRLSKPEKCTVKIYTVTGNLLYSVTRNADESLDPIRLSETNSGVYIVFVSAPSGTYYSRIIKQ